MRENVGEVGKLLANGRGKEKNEDEGEARVRRRRIKKKLFI